MSKIHKPLIQFNSLKKTKKQTTKKHKTINPMLKWAEVEYTFFQRTHTDGQQAHEKMLNIANHQGNANQTHNEISPHTC